MGDAVGNIYKQSANNPVDFFSIEWNFFDSLAGQGHQGQTIDSGQLHYADNIQLGGMPVNGFANSGAIYKNQPNRANTDSSMPTYLTGQTAIENGVFPDVGNSLYRDSFDTAEILTYHNDTGSYANVPIPNKTPTSRPASDDSDNDDMLDAAEIAVFGSITVTNNPRADTNTPNFSGLSGYDNIEKTHFYLAGDLAGGTPPPTPTCSDGIQNGTETGIDCGGSCSPCVAPSTGSKSRIIGSRRN